MAFKPADEGSVSVFILIVLHVVAAFLAAVYYAYRTQPDRAWRMTLFSGL